MEEAKRRVGESMGWETRVTRVQPNVIEVAGVPLQEIIGRKSLPEVAHLLLHGDFPGPQQSEALTRTAWEAAQRPLPCLKQGQKERTARPIARFLLSAGDPFSSRRPAPALQTLFWIGRIVRCLAFLHGRGEMPAATTGPDASFSEMLARFLAGPGPVNPAQANMLEALAVSAVDHGVTAPSAQATRLAASVRAPLETALAAGLGTITAVHGGAGREAAELFLLAVRRAGETGEEPSGVLEELMAARVRAGKRVPGLGHRIHTQDPRTAALWALSEETGTAAQCVRCARTASAGLARIRGVSLPLNVDGAIGAVIADMGFSPELAEGIFLLGRVAGLCAHYFEEVSAFPEMRQIRFSEARYAGPAGRRPGGG
jgi:citrate synthase